MTTVNDSEAHDVRSELTSRRLDRKGGQRDEMGKPVVRSDLFD
jgi:hypothetical protein